MQPVGWAISAGYHAQAAPPHGLQQYVRAESCDIAPADLNLPDQLIDACLRGQLALFSEVRVTQGGENGLVPENLLYFKQVDTRFNQMGGIAVAQTVWCNSFLKPQSRMT